ncbi:hypothetical protein [Amycolatopsis minnesotensis]|uniref:Uncharacterized protein n=1 Tax=Amycolatopsis minnesotensis TaxID=337894 RepID=A0ABP5BWF6_9PSEU
MDLTDLARKLLEPIPANRSAGPRVLRAADGTGEVAIGPAPALANVIGSLHSSGLVALLDAAGLAAIIGAAGDEARFDGSAAKAKMTTTATVTDANGTEACTGAFHWSLRRATA